MWNYLEDYFKNKDKSLLIGQFSALFLILILFLTVLIGEEKTQKTIGLSIFLAGMAIGWITGIILSPYQEYNNEATKFSKALQFISTLKSMENLNLNF